MPALDLNDASGISAALGRVSCEAAQVVTPDADLDDDAARGRSPMVEPTPWLGRGDARRIATDEAPGRPPGHALPVEPAAHVPGFPGRRR